MGNVNAILGVPAMTLTSAAVSTAAHMGANIIAPKHTGPQARRLSTDGIDIYSVVIVTGPD